MDKLTPRAVSLLILTLFVRSTFAAAPTAPPPLKIRFDGAAVIASGGTAGADVLFTGCTRRYADYSSRLAFHLALAKAGANGEARYTIPNQTVVEPNSFWIAADVSSGSYAVAAPDGTPLRQLSGAGSFANGNNGQTNKLVSGLTYAQVVLVRPGIGAWTRTIADGGPADRDGKSNGHIEGGPDDMTPIGAAGPAPKKYDKDDLVFIIAEDQMAFFVTRIGEK